MTKTLRTALTTVALAAIALASSAQALAEVTLYQRDDFRGPSYTASDDVDNLQRQGLRDRATSAVIKGARWDRWELCDDARFRGRCVVLQPGRYPSLAAMGLAQRVASLRAIDPRELQAPPQARDDDRRPAPPLAPAAVSRIVLYENDEFRGRSVTADGPVEDFRRSGMDDRASSVVVSGGIWEACPDTRFGGQCVVLRPGQYPSLSAMGMNDRISSVRAVDRGARIDERRYAPLPLVSRDYGRRDDERLYQADVTAVRAVVEDSGERCWVEPQQVQAEPASNANVPGALLGAVIGGILGHQVGGGTGKDVATGIGVVAGAAIGNNVGRNEASQRVVTTPGVQHCSRNPGQARAAYWDVTYNFRGQEHRVQMTRAPGRTVTVSEQGEPRG